MASNTLDYIVVKRDKKTGQIEGVTPVADSDVANKAYVDAAVGGGGGAATSGVWNPTFSNLSNVSVGPSTTYADWQRIGDVVYFSVKCDIAYSAQAFLTRIDISLPVARTAGNFSVYQEGQMLVHTNSNTPASINESSIGCGAAVPSTQTISTKFQSPAVAGAGDDLETIIFHGSYSMINAPLL